MGIDAYEFYEDTKDLYLIQNKYYSDASKLSSDYVENDFLLRPINALENGTYRKSEELQSIYTKYKKHEDFTVYLQIYVTNNLTSPNIDNYIKSFNLKYPKYISEIFYLDNIENKYYGEIKENKLNLTARIETINKGTILNINTNDYKLENILDARYVFTPVSSIFKIYRNSLEKNYPIFDMNIREYLGNRGVNKKIYETLLDPKERKNFFYYNNGITLICDDMTKIDNTPLGNSLNASFEVKNPQIVNGCQTVNSIYQALKNVDPNNLNNEFKDTFVMLKILQIDRKNQDEKKLYENIVTYNNSQNSIDEKTFTSNTAIFNRLKLEFENKGFLLLIKQSDKNTFRNKYSSITQLKVRSDKKLKDFGISTFSKVDDYFVPLEKLLQVIISFTLGAYKAYTKKSNLLKYNTEEYNTAINFIKNPAVTIESMIDLYLLYKRSEIRKSQTDENRFPIPYYLIDGFSKFECNNRNPNSISSSLSSLDEIDNIIKLYTRVTKSYTKTIRQYNDIEYNQMIKKTIDYTLLESQREILLDI